MTNPTLHTLIEKKIEEANNSDWMKRVGAVESMAFVHGATPYEGQTIQEWLRQTFKELTEAAIAGEREKVLKELASWIDDNVGRSSEALFLYMTKGEKPPPFAAPLDHGDRGRCIVLLKAIPEWIPRLAEIEALHITGRSNGVPVEPWNEQIPLIRKELLTPSPEEALTFSHTIKGKIVAVGIPPNATFNGKTEEKMSSGSPEREEEMCNVQMGRNTFCAYPKGKCPRHQNNKTV